jgi:hypothetical protein
MLSLTMLFKMILDLFAVERNRVLLTVMVSALGWLAAWTLLYAILRKVFPHGIPAVCRYLVPAACLAISLGLGMAAHGWLEAANTWYTAPLAPHLTFIK